MATTYSYLFDDTTDGKRNHVRFLAQDNVAGRMKIADEEIDLVISSEANVYMAAATVADTIAGRLGTVSSKSVGGLSISYGGQHYTALANSLRARGAMYQVPTAGGISVAESDALNADTDRPVPDARRGIHDNPLNTALSPNETSSGRFS